MTRQHGAAAFSLRAMLRLLDPAGPISWHVAFTKSRAEPMVVAQLNAAGVRSFWPLHRPGRRRRLADPPPKPAFPRYVFVGCEAGRPPRAVWSLRGLVCLLGVDHPVVVPGAIMDALFRRCDDRGFMELPTWKPGDRVTIRRDPLANLLGEIRQVIGDRELRVWVDQLNATVRLPVDAVEPA